MSARAETIEQRLLWFGVSLLVTGAFLVGIVLGVLVLQCR